MRKLLAFATTIALPLIAGCTVHQATAPSESGPSGPSLAIKLAANPDHVVQDGLQSAKILVTAFDAGSHPIAARVHLDLQPAGFGTLSTNTSGDVITGTDANNPSSVTYLPPASTTGSNTTVTIFATLVGADATRNSTQQVIVVAQPAVALSSTAPTAVMTLTPSTLNYGVGQSITFDGTGSCGGQIVGGVCSGTSAITSLTWNFGDNFVGTGGTLAHSYTAAGTYVVTLTATNDKGVMATTSQTIVVTAVAAPTAAFVTSPTPVVKNVTTVNFNAATSTAAAGHTLTQFAWNFGDGTSGSGMTVQHVFTAAGTYTVSLTVTDDVGQTKTVTGTVTVT